MLHATEAKSEPKRGRVIHRGIVEAALCLGVDRSHLWRVLRGERQSRSLTRRYRDWNRERKARLDMEAERS